MDEDVTKLTDEELDEAINGDLEQEVEHPESEEQEPQPEEEEKQQPEPEAEQPEEEAKSEEEQPQPSRREQLRIQNLLQKYGNPEERSYQPQPQQQQPIQQLDYNQELEADEEVINRLQQDRQGYGEQRFQEGAQIAKQQADFIRWETSLKLENPAVEKNYPILDKNSPEFHPAVADALNSQYLKEVGFDPRTGTVKNPNYSYAEYVEAQMELAEEIANIKNANTVKNVASQAANTGLRPDGSSSKSLDLNKPMGQMSDEELDAYGKTIGLGTTKRRI